MSNLKHSILAARDWKVRAVEVPEWGLTVHVRTLSVLEAMRFEKGREEVEPEKVVALYLTFALCDEHGPPVFVQADVDDLCTKDPEVLSRIFKAAMALSGDGDAPAGGETPEGKP